MRRAGIAGICALLVWTAGCGPRVAPEGLTAAGPTAGQASPAPTPQDAGSEASPEPVATEEPTQQGEVGAAPRATGEASPGPLAEARRRHNNGAVRIELSATCVRPGDVLTVTFRAPPKAGLGMVIGYSDHQAHGAMLTGESDANGVYVWRVLVEPDVPDGPAKVLVTASGPNWEQEGGGSADAEFQVSRGGC